MRKKIYNIIEPTDNVTSIEKIYDLFMVIVIIASLLPLTIKTHSSFYAHLENVTTIIFIIDYILRLITADFKLKQGKWSFVKYPFTFLAMTDLLAILSSLLFWNNTFRLLKIIRMVRTIRVFKLFRYSKSLNLLIHVLKKQKDSLLIVSALVVTYIFISALVIFNVEPTTFQNFFDALYWATISLTTVGYGDIYAVSAIGKLITMISSILGVAIIALPVSILTAGYLEEIEEQKRRRRH
ncbi:voltage-gated potassium channel [Streptococcus equinus]|uniref:Voltage-gated potassium channel n=1 Tax=Streptococcus equinus TaxID=1335 RepID=A0A1H0QQA7_STREI|nr:ion transporter [Streptococcus equinus]SDP19360.1 voltage-gated potassium channel [Streptococcus equinus]